MGEEDFRISKDKIKVTGSSESVILALEERGFCAIMGKDGKTQRSEFRHIADFGQKCEGAAAVWIDYVVQDFDKELLRVATPLGFSDAMVKALMKSPRCSGYEDFESEMGIMLPAIVVEGFEVKLNPLMLLIRDNIIVTLHTTEVKRFFRMRRYAETLMKKLPMKMAQRDKTTMLLIRIVEENNARNFEHLREIEEHGDQLSHELSNPKTPREILGVKIYQMKHALVVYLGGLWATLDALNSIKYGDADLLTDDPKILNRVNGLIGEVNSQIGLAEHLSEVLASGLEVLQSIYNNQLQLLNNKLAMLVAYLTIIGTALLVPNTIATLLGNQMFNFTEKDIGWYLGLLIVSTIVSTLAAWWFVKRAGLLPKSAEAD